MGLISLDLLSSIQAQQEQILANNYSTKEDFENGLTQRYVKVGSSFHDLKLPNSKPKIKDIENKMISSPFYTKDEAKLSCIQLLEVETLEYNPLQPQVWINPDDELTYLNLYQPPSKRTVAPTPEFIKLWEDYLAILASDPIERPHLLKWLANNYRSKQRSQVALLLYGSSTGTGKGTLQEILSGLHGEDNFFKPIDAKDFILGKFKSEIESITCLALDELYYDGYKVSNSAKPMITERRLAVEPKGKGFRNVTCFFEMIATSNKEQPIWLDPQDRRWLCFNVKHDNPQLPPSAPENERSHGIVKKLRGLLATDFDDTIAMIRHILNQIDLSGYNPAADGAYQTKDTLALISSSGSLNDSAFTNAWDENAPEGLFFNATTWFKQHMDKEITDASKRNFLKNVGCVPFTPNRDGKQRQMKLDFCSHRNGTRGWWITPLGYEMGITQEMTATKIKAIADDYKNSITDMSDETFKEFEL